LDKIPVLRMSEGEPQKKSSRMSTITWIIIGLTLALIAAWTVWAGRQPDIQSVWSPD
jgi:hypothetical protein